MSKKSNCRVSGECLNVLAIAVANTIAKDLTINELSQLSILFTVIGDALGVIAATRTLCGDEETNEASV